MTDEQIVEYCKKLIIHNLSNQQQDFTREIARILSSDEVLLEHCYGVEALMHECIGILENRGDKNGR